MSEQTLTIYGSVGAITGEIRHDGDVRVFGSILPGHQVIAQGSVFVSRDVRDGRALAGGDLVVNGIATGTDTVLDAVGSVMLRQVVDAEVLAGLDIEIRTSAERARLAAGRRVLFTGPPGELRGGTVRAWLGLDAVRIRASGGIEPRVILGQPPFPEDREQLEERQGFARHRAAVASRDAPSSLHAYRRQISDMSAYRSLASSLERRLLRFETAGVLTGSPFLRVTGEGPVQAEVTLGPVESAPWSAVEKKTGGFVAVLEQDAVRVRSLKETTCVG